ncbi:hypothetical protein L195_g056766 [Trifolium pratense]|uniref:Uncharacterized protein n=1 Tax=Trifolium pratense TaxID=57577 RepID=A0A2K3KTB9_TRIPR|nr:hypothetical protein L195_g056766 [Trifolium pratense]
MSLRSTMGTLNLESLPEFSPMSNFPVWNMRGIFETPDSTKPLTPAFESSKAFTSASLS